MKARKDGAGVEGPLGNPIASFRVFGVCYLGFLVFGLRYRADLENPSYE